MLTQSVCFLLDSPTMNGPNNRIGTNYSGNDYSDD